MHITLPRAELSGALAQITRVIESRSPIPILSNVALRTDMSGTVRLTATDRDIEASTGISAERVEIIKHGALTVPGRILADIVKRMAGDSLSLELLENQQVRLKAGRSAFTLSALPVDDFPSLAMGKEARVSFSMAGADLLSLLTDTSFAASTEETRYYLNGVYVHAADNHLRAVATDGHRLAWSELALPPEAEALPGIIIPRKMVAEITRLLKDYRNDVTLNISSTRICLTAGPTVYTSKLIDGTFPDYNRVIPQFENNQNGFRVSTTDLSAAIDRVCTITSDRGRAVKIEIAKDAVTLSAKTAEGQSAVESIDAPSRGTDMQIGFNGSYAQDILNACGWEEVDICLADAGSPALFLKPGGDMSRRFVLMPMRV